MKKGLTVYEKPILLEGETRGNGRFLRILEQVASNGYKGKPAVIAEGSRGYASFAAYSLNKGKYATPAGTWEFHSKRIPGTKKALVVAKLVKAARSRKASAR